MKKVLLGGLVLVLLAIGFVGCKSPVPTSEPDNSKDWIGPAVIEIGKFYPGATADAEDNEFMRVKLHLGENTITKQWSVATDPGETTMKMPPLAQGIYIYGNEKNVRSITSSLPEEVPVVSDYDIINKILTVSGLVPNSSRILTVVYLAQAVIQVRLVLDKYDGAKGVFPAGPDSVWNWITVDGQAPNNVSYTMSPFETRVVYVKFATPVGASLPKKFAFKLGMQHISGQIATENLATFLVTCR